MNKIIINVKSTLNFNKKINDEVGHFFLKKNKNNFTVSCKEKHLFKDEITMKIDEKQTMKDLKKIAISCIDMIIENKQENESKTGFIERKKNVKPKK